MPSNLPEIKAWMVALIAAQSWAVSVDVVPASPEDWLKNFHDIEGVSTPAFHVAYEPQPSIPNQYTDGEWGEVAPLRVTGTYANASTNGDLWIQLRDQLMDLICSSASISSSGLVEDINPGQSRLISQSGSFTSFSIVFNVAHHWARS